MKPSRWLNVLRRVTTGGPYVNGGLSMVVLTFVVGGWNLHRRLCGQIHKFDFTGPPVLLAIGAERPSASTSRKPYAFGRLSGSA